jgi:hypothetical protein
VLAAFGAVAPSLVLGFPKGHDFEFHIPLWLDVQHGWRHGVWFPLWAAMAQFGFGQPIFVFYPPLSWNIGGFLLTVLPDDAAPAAYVWGILSVAGFNMFLFAHEWFCRRRAILAALVYEVNPAVLLKIYYQGFMAELLVIALFPLLVRFAFRLRAASPRPVIQLALVFAGTWLSNLPGALIASYSLVLLVVAISVLEKSPLIATRGAAAMILGFGAAAFFLVPAWYEQRWIDAAAALPQELTPQENFLFMWDYEWHLGFPLLLSVVAACGYGVALVTSIVALRRKSVKNSVWAVMAVLTLASVLMMLPISAILYEYLPKLRFIQFPWRWLFVSNLGVAWFVAAAAHKILRWGLPLTAATLIAAGGVIGWDAPWKPQATSAQRQAFHREGGYYGRPEYMLKGAGQDEVWPLRRMPPVAIAGVPEKLDFSSAIMRAVDVLRWEPEDKLFTVETGEVSELALRLMSYPAWRVEVNGAAVPTWADAETGRVVVQLPAGHSRIRVSFVHTPDRVIGNIISATVILAIALALARRQGRREV